MPITITATSVVRVPAGTEASARRPAPARLTGAWDRNGAEGTMDPVSARLAFEP